VDVNKWLNSDSYKLLDAELQVVSHKLFADYRIRPGQQLRVDAIKRGIVEGMQNEATRDVVVTIDDYIHLLDKRDYHLRLIDSAIANNGGVVDVKPQYDHFKGLAGFIQQSNPNTASMPKQMRNYLVPSSKDYVLVTVDLAQADWNWLQALTLSPSMEAASASGDVYSYIGKALEAVGINLDRQTLKQFTNSLNYGRTAAGLAAAWSKFGYETDEANKAVQVYQDLFPELAAFMQLVKQSRYPFLIDSFATYITDVDLKPTQKAALPAQSGVAAFMKVFMVAIHRQSDWIPIDVIRDMVIYEVPMAQRQEVDRVMRNALESAKSNFGITNSFGGAEALHISFIGGNNNDDK
jgi:hypothetical protein